MERLDQDAGRSEFWNLCRKLQISTLSRGMKMNQFLGFFALIALFWLPQCRAQTNESERMTTGRLIASLQSPADELRVFVNGKELSCEEKNARLREWEASKPKIQWKVAGIGAVIDQRADGLPVISKPMPASPAARAGLLQEDVIVAIDGEPTEGMALTNVINGIRGEVGTTVALKIARLGLTKPLEVSLVREELNYEMETHHAAVLVSESVIIIRNSAQIPPEFVESLRTNMPANNFEFLQRSLPDTTDMTPRTGPAQH